jgi:hypothetical protein
LLRKKGRDVTLESTSPEALLTDSFSISFAKIQMREKANHDNERDDKADKGSSGVPDSGRNGGKNEDYMSDSRMNVGELE